MRLTGSFEKVLGIEKQIRETGRFISIYDGTGDRVEFGIKIKPTAYTRILEYYYDSRARVFIQRGDMVDLFMLHEIVVRFWYNESKKIGVIKFKTSEKNNLCRSINGFNDMLLQLNEDNEQLAVATE